MHAIPFMKVKEIIEKKSEEAREIKLICEVVEKKDLSADKLTIIRVKDDSGAIEIRLFGEDNERRSITGDIKRGDKLLVIGRVVELSSIIYISPKGIQKISDEWYEYYKLRQFRSRKVKSF